MKNIQPFYLKMPLADSKIIKKFTLNIFGIYRIGRALFNYRLAHFDKLTKFTSSRTGQYLLPAILLKSPDHFY